MQDTNINGHSEQQKYDCGDYVNMRFGPAGYPSESKNPKDALDILQSLGLNALEMEYVRGVRTSKEKATEFGQMAKKYDIRLTAHAPYFVSLNSENDETRVKSLDWIMDTVRVAHYLGAYTIVIHAASYGKTPNEATKNVIDGVSKCKNMMDDEGIRDVTIGLETMGRPATWGTLKEIAEVMDNVDGIRPVLDVCHVHARDKGCLKTVQNMKDMVEEFFKLADDRPHFHISCINYGEKGEINHLPLSAKEPDMSLLVEALDGCKKDCNFICESPLLEKDAVFFKNMFDA